VISSWLIPNTAGKRPAAGAIAPLVFTVLLVLFLPESVKFLVHRGKGVARLNALLNALCREVWNRLPGFIWMKAASRQKRQRGTAIQYALAAGHADALDDLLYGIGYLLRAAELDANADAGNGLSAGRIRLADIAVHLRRYRRILLAGWMMDRWEAHKVVSLGFILTMLFALALSLNIMAISPVRR
jgi:AAHS family 4-hydroxybenzoate transporter-like MFS transporter